jgi:class 3 adenylate cyclase
VHDVVIGGEDAAGCELASRLTEDLDVSVLRFRGLEGTSRGGPTLASISAASPAPWRLRGSDVTMNQMSQTVAPLEAARSAAARRAWREAYDGFKSAHVDDLMPQDLEQFAEAAWWTGKRDEGVKLRQRAFGAYSAAGDKASAAQVALALSWDHLSSGNLAVQRGWFAKAERLLESAPESVGYGYLLLSRGFSALFTEGNVDAALPDFEGAFELSQRFADRDLEAMALTGKGKALVLTGDVDRGLVLLDEATAAATGGELRPFSAGFVYCCTIESCQDVGDYRRAAEWTDAANRWCDALDIRGMPGACRVHRAAIMRLRGHWPEAEEQALDACEELRDFNRFVTAIGYYEIGEIRRRRGDFAAAEEAYGRANEWGYEPEPGLALLRLAEGRIDVAVAGVARALENVLEPLARVRILPARIEIALAAGDLSGARAAAAELEQLVDSYKIGNARAPAFDATVHIALGQIALAEGDVHTAERSLRKARDEWQRVGAPYETAQARLLLALAFRRQGDEHGATSELEAALAVFDRLGAKLDQERVKELLGRVEARRTFLFTDIVDSTKLLAASGDEKWKRLLSRHDDIVRERIVEKGGEIIKHTGDGFFASFESPKPAVEAAISIQRALDAEVFAPDVRIGVHTGGAFRTGGNFRDYGGAGVHVAARIGAAAGKGEILVSSETLDGVATLFRASEPRAELLKGFEQPVEVVSVAWRG